MGFFWAGVGVVGFFWTGFLGGATLGFFDLAALALGAGADFLGGFLDLPVGFFFLATPDFAFFLAGGFFFAAGFFFAEGFFLGNLDDFDVFFLAIQVPR
jgi:hypothetical protein